MTPHHPMPIKPILASRLTRNPFFSQNPVLWYWLLCASVSEPTAWSVTVLPVFCDPSSLRSFAIYSNGKGNVSAIAKAMPEIRLCSKYNNIFPILNLSYR